MMNITIMSNNDLEGVCKLYAETFNREPWNDSWTYETALERFKGFMCNPKSSGYIVTEGDELISCLMGRECTFMNTLEFHVDEFFVSESVQGKGYGSIIIEHIEKELKSKGVGCITLMTKHGFPSEKFYEKQGFKTVDSLIFMHKNILQMERK